MGNRVRLDWRDVTGLLLLMVGTLSAGFWAAVVVGLSRWGREDCDTVHPCRPDWVADRGGALHFWAFVAAVLLFGLAVHWLRRGRRAAGWCSALLAPVPMITLLMWIVWFPH